MRKKVIASNLLATTLLQIVTIINGLIVPKLFISAFGSEANGLVTSINQFLNYVTLLEGGLSGVVMASLYKPLRENDQQKISAIFNATQHFFRQIGCIYIVYAVVLAVLYPLLVDTAYSYSYVLVLVLVLAANLFTQYFFSMAYQTLIRAAQRVYFGCLLKAAVILANMVLVVVLIGVFSDLVIVKACSACVFFLQPIAYFLYSKKHFKLDRKVPFDNSALSQRWAGFGHTMAYFINTNCSVMMLTAFSTLPIVSVYSVYLMITNSIRNFAVSIASTLMPSFGNVLAKENQEESNRAFDVYEFGMAFLTTLLFTCGFVLIVPFVKVYTMGVTDADYIQPLFGAILMLAEMVYCFREPYINAAYAAGHFKSTVKFAYIEVVLNLSISFALVHRFNLVGVALGMLIAMIFRMIAHMFYLKNNILFRPIRRTAKTVLAFFSTTALVVAVANWLLPLDGINSYIMWFIIAFAMFALSAVVLLAISLIAFRSEIKVIIGNRIRKSKT